MARVFYIFLLCSLLLTSLSASSRSLTPEELVQVKWLTQPQLSPNGKLIAFQAQIADLEKSRYQQDIYLHNLAGGETRPLMFTRADEKMPRWSPDSKSLGFLSARQDSGKSEPVNQIWLLPLAGGEARQLTNSTGNIEKFLFSTDGNFIYYLSERPRSAAEQRLHELDSERKSDQVVVDRDRLVKEFWRFDLKREKSKLVYRGDAGIDDFDLSPDGRYLAYRSNTSGNPDRWVDYNLYLLTIADSSSALLANLGNEEEQPRFAPNSKAVAFLAPQNPDYSFAQSEINVVNLDSRRVTRLSSDIDLGIADFAWLADSRSLAVNVKAGVYSALYRLSLADLSIEPILLGQQHISSLTSHGDSLAVVFETPESAPEIGLIPAGQRTLFALSKINELPSEITLPEQQAITYRSADNTEIEAVLTQPIGFSAVRKYPAIVSLHGGPASRTVNTFYHRLHQYLAAQGYVVISPNYRGSTGYYAEFNLANINDLGGRDYQDVLGAVDYLASLGYVDSDAIGITGASYGGYLTNWAISQSNRFAAAVSRYGIFNFFTDYGGSEYAYWERERLGNYWDNDSLWLARSPSRYVDKITTPVLIMHGDNDRNTFPTNSMEMYRALRDLGREVEFVRLPREGHGFMEPQHRIIEMERTAAFFNRHLQRSKSFAISGEITTGESGTLTFLSARETALRRLPPPDGRYIVVKLEFSSRSEAPPTIAFDEDVLLVAPDSRRFLPSGLLAQNHLLSGTSCKLRREVFVAELVFDLPESISDATLRVTGFAPLRIKF